ncbi:MAG TPA: molybdopterin-dependent oxidoreductase, partial [Alphaproteobacteria bacterium]|nr:molybdopterin-dependent oxidoreductase [Alphaproteobacteria bacterium]
LPWPAIEARTSVPRAHIERVAERYARRRNVVFAWGMGMTHHLHGVANVEAIANLALLRGMIGRRYAGLLPLRGHSNVQGIGTIGVKPVVSEQIFAAMEQAFGIRLGRAGGYDTMAGLEAADRGEIDAAVMMGGNLWGATPDSDFATRAMGRIGFKLFLTTTLNRGHVHGLGEGESLILPVTARDEEWSPTTQESMFNYVRLSDGGIHRLDNVRPETVILCDLAALLVPGCGIDFSAFKQHRHVREAIAKIVPGMEQLAAIDVARREFHIGNRVLHEPQFGTPDGKAHFVITPLPAEAGAPLVLASVRSEGQFNTIVYEEHDAYRGKAPRDAVFLSREDMAALGISAGQRITVRSEQGRMVATATPFDLPRGSALAYFPEANVLAATAVDPRSRTPAFKSIPVWVEA